MATISVPFLNCHGKPPEAVGMSTRPPSKVWRTRFAGIFLFPVTWGRNRNATLSAAVRMVSK
eukprot:2403938-Alexandrium_andersonii.AAC.1